LNQEDKVWKAIEKVAQKLGSGMTEQGDVPLLIRYEGNESTTMVSDSAHQKRGKGSDEGSLERDEERLGGRLQSKERGEPRG
jgi:hypothetical protein